MIIEIEIMSDLRILIKKLFSVNKLSKDVSTLVSQWVNKNVSNDL